MRIAVDIEGGDHSPIPHLRGAVEALERTRDLELIAVAFEGHRPVVEETLRSARKELRERMHLVYKSEIVPMDAPGDSFLFSVARNRNTTMHAAASLVRHGDADAMLSSGNTAALATVAAVCLRRLNGAVPALMVRMPSEKGHDVVFLDVGANRKTTPDQLTMNARWGNICAKIICGQREPLIRMLNTGTEPGKGNETMREAEKLLREQRDLLFRGNIEPKHMLQGEIRDPRTDAVEEVHVAAIDGFSGNLALKMLEASAQTLVNRAKKRALSGHVLSPLRWGRILAGLALRGTFRGVREEVKAGVGGGMMLGLDGFAFKVHGSAKAGDVRDGILGANTLAQTHLLEEFRSLHGKAAE